MIRAEKKSLLHLLFLTALAFSACFEAQNRVQLRALDLCQDCFQDSFSIQAFNYQHGELMFAVRDWARIGSRSPNTPLRQLPAQHRGRYLHLILNDSMHILAHQKNVEYPIPDGEYRLFALFSEDYHLLRRGPGQSLARDIVVRQGGLVKKKPFEGTALVYHSPWGNWQEGQKPIVDCAVLKPPKGFRLRYSLNNVLLLETDTLQAYTLENLEPGSHTLSIELLDSQGKRIYGPVSNGFELRAAPKEKTR